MASAAVGVAISALITLEDVRIKKNLNDQDVEAIRRLRGLLEDHLEQVRSDELELDSELRRSLDFVQRTLHRIGRAVRANSRRPWILRFLMAGEFRQELLAATTMLQTALAAHTTQAIYVVLLNQQEAQALLQEQHSRLDRISMSLRQQGQQQHTEQQQQQHVVQQRNRFMRWLSTAGSQQQTHTASLSPSPNSSSSSSTNNTNNTLGSSTSMPMQCNATSRPSSSSSSSSSNNSDPDSYLSDIGGSLQHTHQKLHSRPVDAEALSDLLLLIESHCDVMQQQQQQDQHLERQVVNHALDILMQLITPPPGATSFLAHSSSSSSSYSTARCSSDLAASVLLHPDTVPALAAAVWAPWEDVTCKAAQLVARLAGFNHPQGLANGTVMMYTECTHALSAHVVLCKRVCGGSSSLTAARAAGLTSAVQPGRGVIDGLVVMLSSDATAAAGAAAEALAAVAAVEQKYVVGFKDCESALSVGADQLMLLVSQHEQHVGVAGAACLALAEMVAAFKGHGSSSSRQTAFAEDLQDRVRGNLVPALQQLQHSEDYIV